MEDFKLDEMLAAVRINDDEFTGDEKNAMLHQILDRGHVAKRRRNLASMSMLAAVACVAAGLVLAFTLDFSDKTAPIEGQMAQTLVGEEALQLILADNQVVPLSDGTNVFCSEGGQITSNSTQELHNIKVKEASDKKNKLIVPCGHRTFLTLEDGTKVWVNSGTTLEFPVAFASDKRDIYVDGEIYIEVAKEPQRPFYVHAGNMDVKVLGTRFNVSAYSEDASSSIVLVEGLVEVSADNERRKKVLTPDNMLTLTPTSMDITPVDTYDYISWKDGLLQFRSQPLENVLTRLSRYYNVEIECEEDLRPMRCTGKLVLFDSVMTVVETISRTIPLEKTLVSNVPIAYEMAGPNHIIIKRK